MNQGLDLLVVGAHPRAPLRDRKRSAAGAGEASGGRFDRGVVPDRARAQKGHEANHE
jgi:hypothetical protein